MSAPREETVRENLGLVRSVLHRFEGRGVDREDLFQIGTIGLIKAVDRFDETKGLRFSTYAVPMIIGEIKTYLRDDGPLKVSRTIRENAAALAQVRARFIADQGREPSLRELELLAGMTTEDVVLATECSSAVLSLDEHYENEDGEGDSLLDRVSSSGISAPKEQEACGQDEEKDRLVDSLLLHQLLGSLDGEERRLIYLRFFREKTQAQTAAEFGTGQVQISRWEKRILKKMRKMAGY